MSTPEPNDPQRTERILDALIQRADQEELEWESGSPPDAYAANVGASLRMRVSSRDGDGQAPFVFELWGAGGGLNITTGSDPDVDQRVIALYQRGRAVVLDPNKVLTEAERELGLRSATPQSSE
jgi:hypothetical protein